MNVLDIKGKRGRENDAQSDQGKRDVSTLLLSQFYIHPMFRDYESPLRLMMETMHRQVLYDPALSIHVRLYTRVGIHMYLVPVASAMDRLRFADVIRIDVLGVRGDRKMQTDDVLHLTYDFSYLRLFPALSVLYLLNCNICLGSHLFDSAPNLTSFYANACDVYFVAPDFDIANTSGKISLVNMVDHTQAPVAQSGTAFPIPPYVSTV